ncbi:MAG: hypothetical protein CBC48_12850 [bacterium TMED88]|nr:NAD(P)-dependent oxidoreductase [Deltaproteobacteria bacterium]OUV28627.1 MAG: hypothetical protein CBC48_12850 [bacterium TMED88]
MKEPQLNVVVIGASGFVGSALIPTLARNVHSVRCVSRDPDRIARVLPGNALRVQADLLEPDSLDRALAGAETVYYLAHSLGEKDGFAALEEKAAQNFAYAAARSQVQRIIYLGALAQVAEGRSSDHIASRHRVGEILRSSGVPVTEFRASVVIGAGSMAYEVVRALVERLPVMVTPRWVRMPIQPIAQADLVTYLIEALNEQGGESHVYEIGGESVVDYAQFMSTYGRARGLHRMMIPVPVITPRLSSLWLKLVTPAHFRMGRRVVDSAEHASVVADPSAVSAFSVKPMNLQESIERALQEESEDLDRLDMRWSSNKKPFVKSRIGSRFIEQRSVDISSDAASAFAAIRRIGGPNGWYWGNALWKLRGAMDRWVGGPGMRTSSHIHRPLEKGDCIDFWTVQGCDESSRLTLRADMKLPGEASLDLRVEPLDSGVRIVQTASFNARGIMGVLYWAVLHPLHTRVFDGMLRGIAAQASRHPIGVAAPASAPLPN